MGGTSLTLSGGGYGGEVGWCGSGGGIASGMSGDTPQPSYQQGLMIHNGTYGSATGPYATIDPGGMRAVPDVAFDADEARGSPSTTRTMGDRVRGIR